MNPLPCSIRLQMVAVLSMALLAASSRAEDRVLKMGRPEQVGMSARRLEIVKELSAAGIPVGVSIAPIIPALNDHELESIMAAAVEAGASNTWYTLLRLPHELSPLFRDWLETHVPGRARHVMSLIRQMRGGKDYDSDFTTRMRGEGEFAKLLQQRYRIAAKRLEIARHKEAWPQLDCSLFIKPKKPSASSAKLLS